MKIPEVAKRMRELAAAHNIAELNYLADELRRRPADRAPKASRPMTAQLAAQIRAFKSRNPTMTQAAIGRQFNVNPGRVSEALNGFRR